MSLFGLAKPPRALARSWLSDPDSVGALDGTVRTWFAHAHSTRGVDARPPPFTVDLFAERIRRAVLYKQWFVATTVCALLGELVWVASDLFDNPRAKGVYNIPTKYTKRSGDERSQLHFPLQALRNVCVHPGLILTDGVEPPAFERLIAVMKTPSVGSAPLAEYLEQDWARIHERALAAWAIWRIDLAGRLDLGETMPRR